VDQFYSAVDSRAFPECRSRKRGAARTEWVIFRGIRF
jgi:hypothetical protein